MAAPNRQQYGAPYGGPPQQGWNPGMMMPGQGMMGPGPLMGQGPPGNGMFPPGMMRPGPMMGGYHPQQQQQQQQQWGPQGGMPHGGPQMVAQAGPTGPGGAMNQGGAMKDPKLTTVFLSGLAPDLNTEVVRRITQLCGPVTSLKRSEDPVTGKGSGFAFCEFGDAESVLRGIRLLNGLAVGEKSWKVTIDAKAQKFVDMYADKRKAEVRKKLQAEGKEPEGEPEGEGDDVVDMEQMNFDKTALEAINEVLANQNLAKAPVLPSPANGEDSQLTREDVVKRMVEEIADSTNLQVWEERERFTTTGVDKDKGHLVASEILSFRDRLEKKEAEKKLAKEKAGELSVEQKLQEIQEEADRQERRERDRERDEERRTKERERENDRRYRDKLHSVEKLEKDIERYVARDLEKAGYEAEREKRKRRELEDDEDGESDGERRARNRRDHRWKADKERERRADEQDRLREREAIEEMNRRAEAEERRRAEEEKALAGPTEEEAQLEGERVKGEAAQNMQRASEVAAEAKAAAAAAQAAAKAAVTRHAAPAPALAPVKAPVPVAASPPPAEQSKPIKVTLSSSAGKAKAAPKVAPKPSAFASNDDEEDEGEAKSKMRPLIPIDYTEEEMQAVNPNYAQKQREDLAAKLKSLIDSIPEDKNKLYAYPVDWEVVERFEIVDKKMKPWVTKKIVELFDEEEKDFIVFVLKNIKKRLDPESVVREITPVLDAEADQFVAKMWRMLIFEVLRAQNGC